MVRFFLTAQLAIDEVEQYANQLGNIYLAF